MFLNPVMWCDDAFRCSHQRAACYWRLDCCLMRLWRVGGVAIGRLMGLLRRASERVYAPGGTGVESVRREFEALAKGS